MKGGREERKHTSNTTGMQLCLRRCVLPAPLYNNAAVVITVAESKRETGGRGGGNTKKRHVKDKHSARLKRPDASANHKEKKKKKRKRGKKLSN